MSEWGGSGIEKVTFDFIYENLNLGSVFVELGAGRVSTREFSNFFDLYSVEQNESYCNIYKKAKYIYAPIKDGWYDVEILKNNLPKRIKCIFVDGPAGTGNRDGFLHNIDIFDLTEDVMIIFHDTYREDERNLAEKVSKKLGMSIKEYSNGDYYTVVSNRVEL